MTDEEKLARMFEIRTEIATAALTAAAHLRRLAALGNEVADFLTAMPEDADARTAVKNARVGGAEYEALALRLEAQAKHAEKLGGGA